MWENDTISLKTANAAMRKYYELWESAKGNETAQALISSFNDFSLAGVDDFRKNVRNSDLSAEMQDALIGAAENMVSELPKNLAVEMQSFSDKVSKNMEDFEKALSNASKGMDLKDATALASKTNTSLNKDFEFRNGKFFFGDATAIQEAYLGQQQELIDDINVEYNDQLSKLKQDKEAARHHNEKEEVSKLTEEINNLIQNHDDLIKAIEDYSQYATNVALLQNGQIEAFLTSLGIEDSGRRKALTKSIQNGKIGVEDKELLGYERLFNLLMVQL